MADLKALDYNSQYVRFDYDGALNLARALWQLSLKLQDTQNARSNAAAIATRQWQGAFQQEFVQNMNVSNNTAAGLVQSLQNAAKDFATAWQHTADQKRLCDRAQAIQQEKDSRNFVEGAWTWAFGDHADDAPKPPGVDLPQPPSFEPTANLKVPWHW
jgi:hypothetical protein